LSADVMQAHRDAARALVRGVAPHEVIALLNEERNRLLHEEEAAKDHALVEFRLQAEEWAQFRAHMLDGGGVIEERELHDVVVAALMSDDQATFWREAVHVLKAALKRAGRVVPVPGNPGAVNVGPILGRPQIGGER